MKQTLLELTQTILSDMSSDEVNSIGDTAESLQVANHIRETYFNMVSKYNLPEHDQLFQLEGSLDPASPVLMYVPEYINRIEWIQYYDDNPADGSNTQQDQFGAYSQHDVNTDLENNAGKNAAPTPWIATSTTSFKIGDEFNTSDISWSFQVSSNLNIDIGDTATIVPTAQPLAGMSVSVIAYQGTTLTLKFLDYNPNYLGNTYTNWTITQTNPIALGPGYRYIKVLPIDRFMYFQSQLQPTNQFDVETFQFTMNSVQTGKPTTYSFNYKNDKQPETCCIISNRYVIYDSFDSSRDSTLRGDKTMCYGWVMPSFKMEDAFVPQLDEKQFPLLLQEAKSLSFFELKQQPHTKAEKEINRQISALQKYKSESSKPSDFAMLPNFGRKGWM